VGWVGLADVGLHRVCLGVMGRDRLRFDYLELDHEDIHSVEPAYLLPNDAVLLY
jgi:hypothetical protein